MKRAILILAVAALGGCNLCDDPATATFRWRFVDARSGLAFGTFGADDPATPADESGCRDAGIDTVCITAGSSDQCFPCTNAGGLPAARVAPLMRDFGWVVEGWLGNPLVDANATFIFTAQGQNEVRSCSDTPIQVDLVEQPDLVVYYDVNGAEPTACDHLGVIFELVDGGGNVVWETAVRDVRGNVIRHDVVGCDPGTFGFLLPAIPPGVYGFTFLQAVEAVPVGPDAPFGLQAVYEACGVTLEHFRDTVQQQFVNLETAPVPACGL